MQMFCPRCGAQNDDQTKFCRKCGTQLDALALAVLDDSPHQLTLQRKKRITALNSITRGGAMLVSSAAFAFLLAIFSHEKDWIVIWLVLVGWLAVMGLMSVASGISTMLESRLLKDSDTPNKRSMKPVESHGSLTTAKELSLPTSVTENTTSLLNEPRANSRANE